MEFSGLMGGSPALPGYGARVTAVISGLSRSEMTACHVTLRYCGLSCRPAMIPAAAVPPWVDCVTWTAQWAVLGENWPSSMAELEERAGDRWPRCMRRPALYMAGWLARLSLLADGADSSA